MRKSLSGIFDGLPFALSIFFLYSIAFKYNSLSIAADFALVPGKPPVPRIEFVPFAIFIPPKTPFLIYFKQTFNSICIAQLHINSLSAHDDDRAGHNVHSGNTASQRFFKTAAFRINGIEYPYFRV